MDLSLRDESIRIRRMIKIILMILGFVLLPLMALGVEIEPPINITTIPELIETITKWAFQLGLILAPLMILVGAFYFLTAGGSPERVKTGQKIMLWTIIGLGIILFSRVIISIITSILAGTP